MLVSNSVKMPVRKLEFSHRCSAMTEAQSPDIFIHCGGWEYGAFGFASTQASFHCPGLSYAPFSWKITPPLSMELFRIVLF